MSDEAWGRIEPYLPRGRRGARRVDDRRVISGIIHMLKTGPQWRDRPADYRPSTTIYYRFNRWSKQGVWENVFYAVDGSGGVVGATAIDSIHVKAHRSAAGAKGGFERAIGRSRRTDDQSSRHNRSRGRPLDFALTPGQTRDLVGAAALLGRPLRPGD